MNIGIDAGGVMFVHTDLTIDEDTSSTTNWIEGAIEGMKKLKSHGHRLFLVSFAGKRRGIETKKVIQQTISDCIDEKDMIIVNNRSKKGKVCQELGLDIMIDDHVDVLESVMKTSRKTLCFLFGNNPCDNPKIIRVSNWEEVVSVTLKN